jgi:FG-GAP-like repeat
LIFAPIYASAIGFSTAKNYTVRKAPLAVAVGDFNRDGRLDFAVANSGTNNVSILLGRGNSTFQPAVAYPVNQSPKSLAVGDFNGDGKLDVVTANAGSVGVLLRNGNGTFKAAINSSGSQLFGSVAVSDSNKDGRLDLAITNGTNVGILLGKGNGTFRRAVNYSTGGSALSVAVGDFNRDGKLDVAVAVSIFSSSESFSGHVSVLAGRGDGTFGKAASYNVGGHANSLAIGDFNRDRSAGLGCNSAAKHFCSLSDQRPAR